MQIEGIKEIGIGAALMIALMIIREVVTGLLKRNGKPREESETAGTKSVAWWQMEFKNQEDRIVKTVNDAASKTEERLMKRLDDVYMALQTLLKYRGGD